MSFRLVECDWEKELTRAMATDRSLVQIVCPYIKLGAVKRLLKAGLPEKLEVITRFNLADIAEGVSDIAALRLLLDNGAAIRGISGLHSKVYLFGQALAVVTSANLTDSALRTNHEFGFVDDSHAVIVRCRKYFEGLWAKSGTGLAAAHLDEWEAKVTAWLASGARPVVASGLGDEGAIIGLSPQPELPSGWFSNPAESYVKFFGSDKIRAERSLSIYDEVVRSGSHRACTYPRAKRPTGVAEGAVMFMGRLVKDPNDTIIFGWAIGLGHVVGRDEATPADIKRRPWIVDWPLYVRVHHPEFIAGTLANGISLAELMKSLGADSFASTKRNKENGSGNTDPRKAFLRAPAVQLSDDGFNWLTDRLQNAFAKYGKLSAAELAKLDW